MPLFTVDKELCTCDGLCAAECPVGCIEFLKGGLPLPHEKKAAYCINCGHCMAVCPTGAFQLECFDRAAGPKVAGDKISPEQALQFLKGRRSMRAFRDEPLDRDRLVELLDLTQYAPSGHNARPVRWAVAATPEDVQRIASATAEWMRGEVEAQSEAALKLHLAGIVRAWDEGKDLICRHAPALAVPFAPVVGITPTADGVIAITYLELAAYGTGLGACWCGYVHMAAVRDPGVRAVMGIPDDCQVCGALMLGKPARRFRAIPPRPAAEIRWL